ncbi:hypothetical protein [Streptomyces sp. bgisy100]|uniref:hypothetical protein n=1 Tax=Streptomyces sp. bgisy100 TaxID=3413783 RepID=UPI003D7058B2
MNIRRSLGISVTVAALLGTTLATAPPASATPAGCGDLSNGQLCVRGRTGTSGNFRFSTLYWRSGARGEITVKLGSQRKTDRIIAFPLWFGSKKTRNGYAKLSKRHHISRHECVRGVMEYKRDIYFTKWRCP